MNFDIPVHVYIQCIMLWNLGVPTKRLWVPLMYSLLFFDKMVSLKQSDESKTHVDELQVSLDNQCFFVWWGQLAWWCSVSHPVALVMIIYWRVCEPSPECLNHLEKPTFLCLFNNCWMHKYLYVSDLCPQKLVVCRIYFWYVKITLPLFEKWNTLSSRGIQCICPFWSYLSSFIELLR